MIHTNDVTVSLLAVSDIGAEHISVYRRVRRTNNDLESYHRTLVDTLGRPHGNAWVRMGTLPLSISLRYQIFYFT